MSFGGSATKPSFLWQMGALIPDTLTAKGLSFHPQRPRSHWYLANADPLFNPYNKLLATFQILLSSIATSTNHCKCYLTYKS